MKSLFHVTYFVYGVVAHYCNLKMRQFHFSAVTFSIILIDSEHLPVVYFSNFRKKELEQVTAQSSCLEKDREIERVRKRITIIYLIKYINE